MSWWKNRKKRICTVKGHKPKGQVRTGLSDSDDCCFGGSVAAEVVQTRVICSRCSRVLRDIDTDVVEFYSGLTLPADDSRRLSRDGFLGSRWRGDRRVLREYTPAPSQEGDK